MCKFHDPSIIGSRDTERGSEEPPQSQIDQKSRLNRVKVINSEQPSNTIEDACLSSQ